MQWLIVAGVVLIALVLFRDVPIVDAINHLILAVASLLAAVGNLLTRFIPSI
jgi:hypothetical protein